MTNKKLLIALSFSLFLLSVVNAKSVPFSELDVSSLLGKPNIRVVGEPEKNNVCIVYFTGIGCPHCAQVSPVLEGLLEEYQGKLVIIEYEIYQQKENGQVMLQYNSEYGSGLGIPLVIFKSYDHVVGDVPIIQNIRNKIDSYIAKGGNDCPLLGELSGGISIDPTWVVVGVAIMLLMVGGLIYFKKIPIKIKVKV